MSPGSYRFVLLLQYILLLEDLLMNSFVMLASHSSIAMLILHVIQNVCILFSGIVLFLVFINTYMFQAGLVFILVQKFKLTILVVIVYLGLTIGLHAWSLNLAWDNDLFYVESDGFTAFYVIQRLVGVLYYYLYKRSALRMSDPRLYGDSQWLRELFDKREKF